MKIASTILRASIPATTAVLLVSCASFYTFRSQPAFNITGIQAEERTNGYIFKIEAVQKIGRVEAWIGPDNWLYMSIPDTSIDTNRTEDLTRCPIVSRMHLFRYPGSVQVTLKLNQKFDHVGVLSYPGDNNVYIILYAFKEGY